MKYDYLDYEQIKKMGERIKISRKSNNMTPIVFLLNLSLILS